MRIIDQELNIARFRHYLGKEGLYFHGASNDRINYDPNHKKILPPSPEHPFFISDDPTIANRYTELGTDDDGRITDDDAEFTANSRIYILRLKDDVKRTGHYFDFSKKENIRKLRPLFSFQEGYEQFCDRLLDDKRNFFTICLGMSSLDDDFHQDLIKASEDEIKKKCSRDNFRFGSYEFLYSLIYGSLCHHFKNLDRIPTRREIKSLFFRYILDKLHFKVIGEFNTWNGTQYGGIVEFGIMDMSVIRDVYPFPIPIKYASAAANLTNAYFDQEEQPLNISKSSCFISLVDFIAKDPELIQIYNADYILKKWVEGETNRMGRPRP